MKKIRITGIADLGDVLGKLIPRSEKITITRLPENRLSVHVRHVGADARDLDSIETLLELNNGVLRYAFGDLPPDRTGSTRTWEWVRDILSLDYGRTPPPLTPQGHLALSRAEFKRCWGALPDTKKDHVRVCPKGHLRSVSRCFLDSVRLYREERGWQGSVSSTSQWPRRLGKPEVKTHGAEEGVSAHYRVAASQFQELLRPVYKIHSSGADGHIEITSRPNYSKGPERYSPRVDGEHIIVPADLFSTSAGDRVQLTWMRPDTVISLPRATMSVLKEDTV